MSYFAHAFKKVFVGSGDVMTSGTSDQLKPGQIALLDAKTFKAIPVSDAKKSLHKEVILAQGSFHTVDSISPFIGGLKESVKSRVINGNYTSRFLVAHPNRPVPNIVTVGWDGASDCKTLKGELNSDYFLRVEVKGSPTLRAFNRFLYRNIHVHTGCENKCSTDCVQTADRHDIADQIVRGVNNDPELKFFIKAEKIFSPSKSPNPLNVTFNVYHLEVCDTGDSKAIAAVQAQYDQPVKRVSRHNSTSVYELIKTGGTPTSFTTGAIRVVPDCLVCPSGYNLVAKAYKFILRKEEATPANASTAASSVASAYSATQAVYMGNESGVSTYILYMPTSTTPVAGSATEAIIATGEVVESFCSLASPGSIAWTAAGTKYKTVRTLCMTLPKDCDEREPSSTTTTTSSTTSSTTSTTTTAVGSKLASVRAFYAGNADVVPGSIHVVSSGDCAEVFEIKQYNKEYLEDPCSGEDVPSFDSLPSFEGHIWEECPCQDTPEVDDTSLVGVRFVAAYADTKFGNCSFEPTDHYELEPLEILVSQVDRTGDVCESLWPVTEIQVGKQASGVGETVLRNLILFQGYRQERFYCDPRRREVEDDFTLDIINRNGYYKTYYIFHNVPYLNRRTNLFDNEQYVLEINFPEDVDTSEFEQVVGSYLASNNVYLESL